MKKSYLLSLFIFLISCASNLDDSNSKILDEIMNEHDILMEKMSELKKLENNIKSTISDDSLSIRLVSDLKNSHRLMMMFMQEFSNEFPFDKYPMNKEDKNENSDLEDVNKRLIIQKERIFIISESFEESILNAQNSLGN
jgi:hypothetical protein|tara:strand:+ start:3906 stop:4325 length:420 start_codon:yes stop_codon:yes gene_type:complete